MTPRHLLDADSAFSRPLVRGSIGLQVRDDRVEKSYYTFWILCEGQGVWAGVVCPCLPIRDDISSPRYLFCCKLYFPKDLVDKI